MEFANGDKYNGEWVDGEKEGTGQYTYSNGDVYLGNFEKGKKSG